MPPRKKAKRLGINTHVVAAAVVALGESRAHEAYGAMAHTQMVKGVIKEQIGQGRGRTWRIRWETDDISTLPTRSIERDRQPDVLEMHQQPSPMPAAPTGMAPPPLVPVQPVSAASQAANSTTNGQPDMNHDEDDDYEDGNPHHAVAAEMQPAEPAGPADHTQQLHHSHARAQAAALQPQPAHSYPPHAPSTVVHDITWTTASAVCDVDRPRLSFSPPTHCSILRADDFLGFFLAAFPSRLMDALVSATSANLAAKHQRAITTGEMLRVFGALLGVAHVGLPIRQCWDRKYHRPGVFAPLMFKETFGLSQSRFEMILNCLAVVPDSSVPSSNCDHDDEDRAMGEQQQQQQQPPTTSQGHKRKSWLDAVEPAIEMFNGSRRDFRVGSILVLDESMSRFVTKTDYEDLMAIHRKPEPVGFELKSLADGQSGVMLWLELQRSSVPDEERAWSGLGANCAWALRATESYHGSGRVLIGDSAFACVKTAYELRRRGLHFIGNVKLATKHFPKVYRNHYTNRWARHPICAAAHERTADSILSSCPCLRMFSPHSANAPPRPCLMHTPLRNGSRRTSPPLSVAPSRQRLTLTLEHSAWRTCQGLPRGLLRTRGERSGL